MAASTQSGELFPDWKTASKSRREKIARRIADRKEAKNHDIESIRARRARLEELTKAMKSPTPGRRGSFHSKQGKTTKLEPIRQKEPVPNEFDKRKEQDIEKLSKPLSSSSRRSIGKTNKDEEFEEELMEKWMSQRRLGHDERSIGGDSVSRRSSYSEAELNLNDYDDDVNFTNSRSYSGVEDVQSEEESYKKEKLKSDHKKTENYETDTKENVTPSVIQEIIRQMRAITDKDRLMGVYRARKHLSKEANPPIDEYIEAGAVPPLVSCLNSDNPNLQFEAAWVITNITSGHTDQSMAVYEAGAIPQLIHLLNCPYIRVSDQCVWAIGNMAGDGPFLWQVVVDEGCIKPLYSLIERSPSLSSLRNLSWTFSNLLRHKPLNLTEADFSLSVKAVRLFLHHPDKEIHVNACWSLVYITDNNDSERIEDVIKAGILPRLIEELLDSSDIKTITPAIRAIGNIMTGTDEQTERVVSSGVIPILVKHLKNSAVNIRKDSAWALSNITAGTENQIQSVIDGKALPPLLEIIKTDEAKVKKEASWCISNMTEVGTPDQLDLIIRNNLVGALASTVRSYGDDLSLLIVTFEGLKNILEKCEDRTEIVKQIEEQLSLQIIEEYTHHENEYLQNSAHIVLNLINEGTQITYLCSQMYKRVTEFRDSVMDTAMFPSVTGSTRFKNEKAEFPMEQEDELEVQRSRLANMKNQQVNKRRRPTSQKVSITHVRKPSKVILEPIKVRTPNELDHKFLENSLRKTSFQRQDSIVSSQVPNLELEKEPNLPRNNYWKMNVKADIETIFAQEKVKGRQKQMPFKPKSIPVITPRILNPPSSLTGLPKPIIPQSNKAALNALSVPPDSSSVFNLSFKKSLSDSRINTPRLQTLTNRSQSINSLIATPLAVPHSPSPSLLSALPSISSSIVMAPFASTNSLIKKKSSPTPPMIATPSPKLASVITSQTQEMDTPRSSNERPVSTAKRKHIEEAVDMIKSNNEEDQLKGASIMHKHLSLETNPPVDTYIILGVLQPLAAILKSSRENLVLAALLALTGVISGTFEQTRMVAFVENVMQDMLNLLSSENEEIVDQCIICLGTIAENSEKRVTEALLNDGIISRLAALVKNNPKVERGQKLAWIFSNVSQPCYLQLETEDLTRIVDSLLKLLELKDQNTAQTSMWVLSYITERGGNQINEVINKGLVPILFKKIDEYYDYPSMLFPMLRVMGNIASGDNLQTQYVIDHGLIAFLVNHCGHYILKIRKECLWILSNITAGIDSQIQSTIDHGVFPTLNSIVQKETDIDVLKEAGWAIANVFWGGTQYQIDEAIVHNFPNCLAKVLFQTASHRPSDSRTLAVCLEALRECLMKCSSVDPFFKSVFYEMTMEDFEVFTYHESDLVVNPAKQFINLVREKQTLNNPAKEILLKENILERKNSLPIIQPIENSVPVNKPEKLSELEKTANLVQKNFRRERKTGITMIQSDD